MLANQFRVFADFRFWEKSEFSEPFHFGSVLGEIALVWKRRIEIWNANGVGFDVDRILSEDLVVADSSRRPPFWFWVFRPIDGGFRPPGDAVESMSTVFHCRLEHPVMSQLARPGLHEKPIATGPRSQTHLQVTSDNVSYVRF